MSRRSDTYDRIAASATGTEWGLVALALTIGLTAGAIGLVGDLRGWWVGYSVQPDLIASICGFGFALPTTLLLIRHVVSSSQETAFLTGGERSLVTLCLLLGIAAGVCGLIGDRHEWWSGYSVLPNLVAGLCGFGFALPTTLVVVRRVTSSVERHKTFKRVALEYRQNFSNAAQSQSGWSVSHNPRRAGYVVRRVEFDDVLVAIDDMPPTVAVKIIEEWIGVSRSYRRPGPGNLVRLKFSAPPSVRPTVELCGAALRDYRAPRRTRSQRGRAAKHLLVHLDELDLLLASIDLGWPRIGVL